MKRKLYSTEYVHMLEEAAKKPAVIEETAAEFTTVLIDFLETKGQLDEFENWSKENHPELVKKIDSI